MGGIRSSAAGWFAKDDEQRKRAERCDHQQFVIVDIGDDLGLLRHHRIESRAARGCQRIPEVGDCLVLEGPG